MTGTRQMHNRRDGNAGAIHDALLKVKADSRSQLLPGIKAAKSSAQIVKDSEELFRTIAENTGDAIVTANQSGIIIYLNRSALAMFGYKAEDVLGKRSSMLLPEEIRSASEQAENRVSRTGVMINEGRALESVALRKDGTEFPIEFTITRHNTREGLYFSFIIRDITERTHSREALEKAYAAEKQICERLEEDARRRMDFSKALVHELKTPLTPILASTELMMEESLSESGLVLLKNIQRGAANLNLRIDELLDLALGEAGQIELVHKDFNLASAIRSVLDDSAVTAAGKSLSLILVASKRVFMVEADEGRVRQVVRHLVNNAIRSSPEGGRVQVRLHRSRNLAVIEVGDESRGLAQEDQKHVFEAYRRPRDERRRLGGLGIGLAVARVLVELHGGEIGVSSEPDRGNLFHFSLPIRRKSVAGFGIEQGNGRQVVPAD